MIYIRIYIYTCWNTKSTCIGVGLYTYSKQRRENTWAFLQTWNKHKSPNTWPKERFGPKKNSLYTNTWDSIMVFASFPKLQLSKHYLPTPIAWIPKCDVWHLSPSPAPSLLKGHTAWWQLLTSYVWWFSWPREWCEKAPFNFLMKPKKAC